MVFDDWNSVDDYLNSAECFLQVSPAYLSRAVMPVYPRDAFSKGQLISKAWLLNKLFHHGELHPQQKYTVAILGCWIGSLVEPLMSQLNVQRIYGLDLDPESIALAEQFNQRHVQNNWLFKGVVADVSMLKTGLMQFETGGELIQVTPDIVINTSCEHMDTHWFDTASPDQLIVMQTNDNPQYAGHINVCASVDEMKTRYPLTRVLYAGELRIPAYTRLMQIGYR
jgi:hypothetical protein